MRFSTTDLTPTLASNYADDHKKEKVVKLDRVNIGILRHVKDGRKSFKEIASELSIAENTVRSRVNKMVDAGLLHFSGLVDIEVLTGHSAAYFGICLANTDLVTKGEELSRLRGVVSCSIVTGRYDLFIFVLFDSDFDLVDFVTKEVTKISEVVSTEAFVAFRSWNLRVPYVL